MRLICPECKNEVDLANYPDLDKGHVVECDQCGITLLINSMEGEKVDAEVVEEGK